MSSQSRLPDISIALLGFCALSYLLYLRSPTTGFVFDEQEALLANPYLMGDRSWLSAFFVDFWGRTAEATIGSYRPLPNLLWWFGRGTLERSPWVLHLLNPLVHGLNALLIVQLVRRLTGARRAAWLAGLHFVTLAAIGEAVSTVVGLADLLVASCALTALLLQAVAFRGAPSGWCLWIPALGLAALTLLGLLAKETMLSTLPLIVGAPLILPSTIARGLRKPWQASMRNQAGALAGLVLFVVLRRRTFGVSEAQGFASTVGGDWIGILLGWMGQARLPIDAMNNPALEASTSQRLAIAAHVFGENAIQLLVPWQLCGDYSFPRLTPQGWNLSALSGALLAFVGVGWVAWRSLRRLARGTRNFGSEESSGLATFGGLWMLLTYLPISGVLVLLPTIRAERLLYVPAIGLSLLLGAIVAQRAVFPPRRLRWLSFAIFLSAVQARAGSLRYTSDVLFWETTALGHPASAKAHLNLGIMQGARGAMGARLQRTRRAVALAPDWPLGRFYLADGLCRAGRGEEALPHYLQAFELDDNRRDATALALQCLWESGQFPHIEQELELLAQRDDSSWLTFLLSELQTRGREFEGVPPKYRPRGYNQPSSQ